MKPHYLKKTLLLFVLLFIPYIRVHPAHPQIRTCALHCALWAGGSLDAAIRLFEASLLSHVKACVITSGACVESDFFVLPRLKVQSFW